MAFLTKLFEFYVIHTYHSGIYLVSSMVIHPLPVNDVNVNIYDTKLLD